MERHQEQVFWLAFSLIKGFGTKRITQIWELFGSLASAWEASSPQLKAAGLTDLAVQRITNARRVLNLSDEMRKIQKVGAHLVTLIDSDYPALLRNIPDAPPVLYVLGSLLPEDYRALAVVGTRSATHMGRETAFALSRKVAAHRVTIVSGLAHGIDAQAHLGALAAGGRTIAVVGCGVDIVYPPEHRGLAQQIATQGALISEFPIGTAPERRNFPRRNRIISGLALGVLVVEAPKGSGALITAELAAQQGRDVFAVPASVNNAMGSGTNQLIQEGAKLVMDVDDILSEFGETILQTALSSKDSYPRLRLEQMQAETAAAPPPPRAAEPSDDQHTEPDDPVEVQVMACLSMDPIHVDDIVRSTGLNSSLVHSTLTILELKGLAQMTGHMHYSRIVR